MKWQKIYETPRLQHAYIVQGVLQDNHIESEILDKTDSIYLLGQYEIYVLPENVLTAIRIIQEDVRFE